MADAPQFIPDSQFVEDAPTAPVQGQPVEATRQPSAAPLFIPDDKFVSDEDKYGSTGQQIITGLEGASQGLVGPLAPAAERLLGVKPEDIRGREHVNPDLHTASELAGFVGPAILSGGASLLGKAGVAGAAKAATAFTQAGLLTKAGEAVSAATGLGKAGSGFISQISKDAVQGAFEMGLMQGGEELGKLVKEDPDQTANLAISHMGLAVAMGGVFGGAVGAALRKAGIHPDLPAEGLTPGEGTLVSNADKAAYEAGDLKTHIELDSSLPAAKKEGLLEAFKLNKEKVNAKELRDAAKTLGAPETPGMTLESPLIQMQVDSLAHSPYTYSGNKIRKQLDAAYEAADTALKGATESANGLSKDELGQALQTTLTADTREAYAPVQEAFQKVADLHPNVPVALEDIGAFRAGLKDIKEVALGTGTEEGKLARSIVNVLQNAKTAEDLTTIRNMSALKKSGVGADPLGHIKGVLRDRLQTLQDDVVAKYAKSFPRNDEVGAIMHNLIDQDHVAKQLYKPYIRKVGELSEWMGKGKIHGTEDALNFMNERLSSSDVAKRLFSASKDPQFLKFFSREFPKQFELVKQYQRMALRESAITGEDFSAKTFFNKFNKMEPELQKALYSPEELKKIAAAETFIRDAFPKNFNPSGTSHALALKEAYTTPKSMILANARDLAMEKIIKMAGGSPGAAQAISLAQATVAGNKLADKGVKSLFTGIAMPAALMPTAASRDKLSKLVTSYQADPSKMLGQNDSNPIPEYAQAFSATTGRAMQYLASVKPDTTPKGPLDSKIEASPMQKAAYNRALDIAQQPLNVLVKIQNGTLTQQDVTALNSIYPSIYKNLSQKIMSNVIDSRDNGKTIPYKARLQMSLFLGQPLDSTMTQPAIMAIQMQSMAKKQQEQQQTQQKPPSASSTKGLDKLGEQAQSPRQGREAARAKRDN